MQFSDFLYGKIIVTDSIGYFNRNDSRECLLRMLEQFYDDG